MFDASSRKLSKTRISAATFCSAIVILSVSLSGCGVVGDILPPALNLPMRATELTAIERGKNIDVTFKLPALTTEGMQIRRPPELDLRIGTAPADPNDINGWASHATRVQTSEPSAETPAAPWVNQKVFISVRLLNERGKDAGWTQPVVLTVIPPVATPTDFKLESQPAGIHLSWKSTAPKFRVFRHSLTGPGFEQIATPEKPEYDDNVDFGKEYSYYVQALAPAGNGTAESEDSPTKSFTPKDIFPPAAPTGLQFILGGKTIELTWTHNTESDIAGYQVYRAFENNGFERIKDTQDSTSYSDRNIEPGRHYRYAVTAVDRAGNESKMSAPVTVTAP